MKAAKWSVQPKNQKNEAPPPSARHCFFPLLTVCNLQQCFGDNTASYVESLAAVVASIWAMNIRNSQTAYLGHRQTAKGLRWLVREQKTLERGQKIC